MLKMSNSRNKRTNTHAAEGTGEVVTWEWEDGGLDSRSPPPLAWVWGQSKEVEAQSLARLGGALRSWRAPRWQRQLSGALRSEPRGGTQWRLAVGGWGGSEGARVSRGDS